MAAVQAEIRELVANKTLPGIAAENVVVRKAPILRDFVSGTPATGQRKYPGIVICPPRSGETLTDVSNKGTDWGFPVAVAIIDQDNQDAESQDDLYYLWRQEIINRFIGTGTTNLTFSISSPSTDFHDVAVEPLPIVQWEHWLAHGKFVSSFLLRFTTRRLRA